MSAETESKPESEANETPDHHIPEAVKWCMQVIDDICIHNKLEPAAMIYLTVSVASHLICRNLLLANGSEGRQEIKKHMENMVYDILNVSCENMDRTEREMAGMTQGGIITPH